ncbi:hypothetical protein PFISCL1PPCAC_24109, partial [Pristionchus fissidentatus]
ALLPLLYGFVIPSVVVTLILIYSSTITERVPTTFTTCSLILHFCQFRLNSVYYLDLGIVIDKQFPIVFTLRKWKINYSIVAVTPYVLLILFSFFFGQSWNSSLICGAFRITYMLNEFNIWIPTVTMVTTTVVGGLVVYN